MDTKRPFSQTLWEQTPAAVQDYICAIEARVMALDSAVQHLEATVQQVDGAVASRLTHLLTAPIERSAAGDRETPAPRAQ
jgi:hypothetical protein